MTPSADEIAALRAANGLTQAAMARLLHTSAGVFRQWESGNRRMHPAMWELLRIKLAHNTDSQPRPKTARSEPVHRA
jgi:DNA-binding transcriptional regulator YiaG